MVATMSFAGATPETSSSVESFIPGLPSFIAQLNLAIVALVVNLVVVIAVSAVTRTTAATPASGRFRRAAPVSSRS
jgi:solute:Na+ symporter, SSS family